MYNVSSAQVVRYWRLRSVRINWWQEPYKRNNEALTYIYNWKKWGHFTINVHVGTIIFLQQNKSLIWWKKSSYIYIYIYIYIYKPYQLKIREYILLKRSVYVREPTTSFPIIYNNDTKESSWASKMIFSCCKIEGKSSCHVNPLTILTRETLVEIFISLSIFEHVLYSFDYQSHPKTKYSCLFTENSYEKYLVSFIKLLQWPRKLLQWVGNSPLTGS